MGVLGICAFLSYTSDGPSGSTRLNKMNFPRFKVLESATLLLCTVAALLCAPTAHAALKCEELVAQRFCADNAPKAYQQGPGQSVMIPAPIISGYSTACWSWTRKFQCVETDPVYTCDSGSNFSTVKSDCSLTGAVVNATVTIKGVKYITEATYDYQCAFGEWTTDQSLPANRECVLLDETVTDTKTVQSAAPGSTPSTSTSLGTTLVSEQAKEESYVCYLPAVTTCADKCYEHVTDPATGQIVDKEVPCTGAVTNCSVTSTQCDGTYTWDQAAGTGTSTSMLGPDGRCIASTELSLCQNGPIPKCLEQDNCTLTSATPSGIQDNGTALSQEQTYICSNTSTTCTQYADVSNCVHVSAWGWDNQSLQTQVGQGLAEANQALAKLEGVEKGQKQDDPYIFSGQDLRCHFAVGNFMNTFIAVVAVAAIAIATGGAGLVGLQAALGVTAQQMAVVTIGAAFLNDAPDSKAMGADCCKDYVIEGSDAWFKLGACTADEVKLAVARQKDLDVYLGEYCSKKSGFPVRQCVEKTRTFCVFDDMLALTVNEQGRQQLDAIALADPIHTKVSAEKALQLFSELVAVGTKYDGVLNNGKWVKQTTEANSQIWTWQYPGYCVSQAEQSAAYNTYMAELNALADTKGIKTGEMTKEQAAELLRSLLDAPSFQECAATPGMMYVLTCSKKDDSCDQTKLPESPSLVEAEIDGGLSQADVNWRTNQVRTFYMPGDYGVTAMMATDPTFAAVTASVSEYVSSVGSCHTSGDCLFKFAVTDKTAEGTLGAKKRTKQTVRFPLYSVLQTSTQPSVPYVSKDGVLDLAAYKADPNRGAADETYVSSQRFIFHPHYLIARQTGNIHTHVLLEYANQKLSADHPEDDYTPLMLPTSLPPGTTGWYPYGDASRTGKSFYISGGCDVNSHWCEYEIEVDLNVPRHPWGSAKEPRCWGFSLDQLSALDFNKMDLSRWINSLDFGSDINGMSTASAKAMTEQATKTAQAFYDAMQTGASTTKPNAGSVALVTSADILPNLSGEDFQAYTLTAGVPTNWPAYYDDQPNNNPVTNVKVDWGDGTAVQSMVKHSEGRAWILSHDYGDKPVATYTIKVTLDTVANGSQTLTTAVKITPDSGATPAKTELTFDNQGTNGDAMGDYTPATTVSGTSQAPDNLTTTSPATVDQYCRQGSSVTGSTTSGTSPDACASSTTSSSTSSSSSTTSGSVTGVKKVSTSSVKAATSSSTTSAGGTTK